LDKFVFFEFRECAVEFGNEEMMEFYCLKLVSTLDTVLRRIGTDDDTAIWLHVVGM